ncbi:MAG: glycosyltransferase, partial [Bacteroidia bacterium]|nr:glycosyltransferase [Bacteroidia bacterium]
MLLEKVLVISYYWPPSGGAGVQRALKFVRYLGQYGFQPIVLTVDPQKASYPVTDPSLSADLPSGLDVHHTASFEPLNLLSALLGKKNVPYGGFANANKESRTQRMLRWIRGNFFIPDARAGWVPYAFREAVRIIEQQQIKVVFISSPPHSSQLIGLKLKKRFPSLHWVADMRDPWTDIYYYKDLLHTPPAAARDARYEREVLEGAGVVLVVSEAIKRSFLKKSAKLSPDKIKVIPNGYDEHDFQREEQPEAGHFTITYVGTMAELYRPEVFFRVFRSLLTKHPEINLRFRFVGNAPWTLRKMVEDMGLAASCEWIGHVSHADAISYMLRSDALLLIIPDSEGAEGILTGKLFEYLGARRLIIGLGPVEG